MSKIEQLIKELCPGGVDIYKFGDCCTLKARIGWQGLTKKEYRESGSYKLVTGTDFTNLYTIDFDHCVFVDKDRYDQDENIQLKDEDVLITKDGTLGKVAYIDKLPMPATLNGGVFVVRDKLGLLNQKYLMYFMVSNQFKRMIEQNHTSGSIQHLTQGLLTNFDIPLPPLPIQQEIVRILDTFTEAQANLEQELELRKKQYEYYRNQLLTFDENDSSVKWMTLGDCGKMIKGNGILKSDFVDSGVPCIHYGQLHTYYGLSATSTISYISEGLAKKSRFAHKGDLVIATTSEDVEACCKACAWLGEEAVAVSGDAHIFVHDQNPKYMAYLFRTNDFAKQKQVAATGAKVTRVSGDNMLKFKFLFPSKERQQEIVSILDKFESAIQTLEEELALRKKQYEYYREKLLTFN